MNWNIFFLGKWTITIQPKRKDTPTISNNCLLRGNSLEFCLLDGLTDVTNKISSHSPSRKPRKTLEANHSFCHLSQEFHTWQKTKRKRNKIIFIRFNFQRHKNFAASDLTKERKKTKKQTMPWAKNGNKTISTWSLWLAKIQY